MTFFRVVSGLFREVVLPLVRSEVVSGLTALGTAYTTATFGPVAALALFAGATMAMILLHLARSSWKELEDLKSEVSRQRVRADNLAGRSAAVPESRRSLCRVA